MSTAGWASCLDSFADHLAYQRQALAEGTPEVITAFVPPATLGPLPAALLPRARELHVQAEALTDVIADARTRIRGALEQIRRPTEVARPSYVDSRA
jgi:hypothetical protein